MDSGQWTMDNGQWTVDNGQWTMDSLQNYTFSMKTIAETLEHGNFEL